MNEEKKSGAALTAEKRREMKGYRALKLLREHKSKAGRRKVEEGLLFRFVGKGSADEPFLKVTRREYFRVWHECADQLRLELTQMGFDGAATFALQREKHERMVYRRLAEGALRAVRSEAAFERLHGRPMTPHERDQLAREQSGDGAGVVEEGDGGRRVRQFQVARVLGSIGAVAKHEPTLLQEAWAGLVGPAIAAEVVLESVDPGKGLAFCRCLSAARAYDLRRRRALPAKLSDALGLRIEKIVFR
ncbi:MAG: hypothetical protein SNJ84_06685 [Verrucomicrobiia bacterium]